ncbi:hypothetical protein HJC22_36040 [Corallococcus exiguus]|uniref:restriction endonuclease fold toxin 5 domain-containing protein n=1 Tax=Corallococcus exiguus TaxID=83462 RepID=UPI001470CDF6|nr:restriction endonuclease fold toxin 5 domain-containing protein [Corallococcus exiguus]NNC21136.1 hypothetical protein [Corallococcus exiguus]
MSASRAGVWGVLVVLLTGCASGPTVRLRTEQGTRTYAPATWDKRVPVSAREFEEALARLVLEVPLTVRSPRVVRAVAKKGAQLDLGFGFMLRDGYGRWCRAHEAPGDCLSLLEDGAGFGELDRLTLAVTMLVSHGVTMGLSSALAWMPRFPDAVRLGSTQAGFNPARVLDVSAVAVVDGVVEVTLASTAVAMAAMGPPPSSSSAGGPGKWVQVNESMSDRARDYQAQVTGAPKGSAYRLKVGDEEVDFDGYDLVDDSLLEAKGQGYEKFIKDNMEMKDFFKGFRKMLVQADRQLAMAQGRRIRWIVAEERFATFLKQAFLSTGRRIEVVHIAPLQ